MPVEVLRTLRRYESSGLLTSPAADLFAAEVGEALALAERYGVHLVTLDKRLAKAAEQTGVPAHVPG